MGLIFRTRSATSILPCMTVRGQSLAPEVFHGTTYQASVVTSIGQVAAYRRRMARERFERPRILGLITFNQYLSE